MEITDGILDGPEHSCLAREECIQELLKDLAPGCLYCRLDED